MHVCVSMGVYIPVCTCIFFIFLEASDKDVSVYQTWVFLYPAFHFFPLILVQSLQTAHRVQSRVQSLLYIWRTALALDGTTLNPTLTGRPGFITWWFEPEQNRGHTKYQIAMGTQTFWPCPYLKSVSSSVSCSLSFCPSVFVHVCHGFQLQEGHCKRTKVDSLSLIC